MARLAAAALCLALLLATFDFGVCLRCYQCNSQSDPKCRDPFDEAHFQHGLVDCSAPETLAYNRNYLSTVFKDIINDGVAGSQRNCHKIVMQSGTTIRTCLDVNPSDPNHTCRLLEASGQGNPGDISRQIKTCRFCNSDSCNGSGSIAASLPLAAITALVAYLMCKQ